ncbi:alkaline phosphatase, partial [Ectothiorhodospira sp. PHS-1]
MNFRRSAISIAVLMAAFSLHGCSSDNDSDKNRADQNPQAKNVILMITDGASWGTWDMASYWEYGERGRQPYDQFDVKLGMITPPLNTSNTPTFTGIPQVTYDPEQAWDTTPVGSTTAGRPNHFAGYEYLKEDYTDSAAAGTVLATGQKTYNNAIDYDDFAQPLTLEYPHVFA